MTEPTIIDEETREFILLAEAKAKENGEATTVAATALRAAEARQPFNRESVRAELELNAPIHGAKPKFEVPK